MVIVLLFYREQHKKLAALEMELVAAQQEDFASKNLLENKGTPPKKRLLAVVGIITKFGHKNNRDASCRGMDANWGSLGGKVLRFVIWGVLVLWELIGVWVGRNLGFEDGGESWIRCRPIAAFPVATNRPIGGVGAFVWKLGTPSERRRPQQPLPLDPPPDRASNHVSPLLLLQRSQFHRTLTPMLQ
ncbi:hypothetical protein VitviT2T_001441 [Vitis vinifera]|uniref:Hexosyltransferase n=1 Tax=Vitis vinifera TaxID=29760 RepID=A0ABY9BG59_VITVI|nr:hypothetical protein VitviT2T_001441 [Vitis vinifera]